MTSIPDPAAGPAPVLAVVGLAAEARIAAGAGVATIAGGGDAGRLARSIEAALAGGARAVISFGIAGGLAPDLGAGTLLVGRRIHADEGALEADLDWAMRLAAALPGARLVDLAGVDAPIAGPDGKAALHRATGAAAVDMESHVAARAALRQGVPFAALRAVADPAGRALPRAALVGMRPDGSSDAAAVLAALLRDPRELPGLVRTALDARAALAALAAARRRLSPGLDGP